MLKKMLPKNNELPESMYETKKTIFPLGLEVQKIHACPNDCILYRGEYGDLNASSVCDALRYKISCDDPGDVDGERPRKKIPAKVMWYAPIISQLQWRRQGDKQGPCPPPPNTIDLSLIYI